MAPTMDRNQCEACGLTFDSEEEMKKHERAYHAQKPAKEGTGKVSETGRTMTEQGKHSGSERREEPKRKAS